MKVDNYGQYYLEEVYKYKEELSIKDYLELHQQLWNTIIKILIKDDSYYYIDEIKYQGFLDSGQCKKFISHPINFCWCCEFSKDDCGPCEKNCLVNWGGLVLGCGHIYSPYTNFMSFLGGKNRIKAVKEAALIRDLPLNKRYENEKE